MHFLTPLDAPRPPRSPNYEPSPTSQLSPKCGNKAARITDGGDGEMKKLIAVPDWRLGTTPPLITPLRYDQVNQGKRSLRSGVAGLTSAINPKTDVIPHLDSQFLQRGHKTGKSETITEQGWCGKIAPNKSSWLLITPLLPSSDTAFDLEELRLIGPAEGVPRIVQGSPSLMQRKKENKNKDKICTKSTRRSPVLFTSSNTVLGKLTPLSSSCRLT